MPAHLHYSLSFCFTIAAVVLAPAAFGQTSTQAPPDWKADPAFTETLKAPSNLDWFTIRAMPEYTKVNPPNASALKEAGIKIEAWTKETEEGISPALTVMFLPATNDADHSKFFEGLVHSLSTKLNDVVGSPTKAGRWHDRNALRFDFSAKSPEGQAVSGMVIAIFDDSSNRVVSAVHPTDTSAAKEKSKALVASALSVTFNDASAK